MATFTPTGEIFSISLVGDATRTTWAGQFTVKTKLSWRDQLQMDKLRREFLGPDAQGASPDAIAQAVILAELSVRVIEAPQWWFESKGGLEMCDDNVLTTIYEKTREVVIAADKQVEEEGEQARKELGAVKRAKEDPKPVVKGNRRPLPVEE